MLTEHFLLQRPHCKLDKVHILENAVHCTNRMTLPHLLRGSAGATCDSLLPMVFFGKGSGNTCVLATHLWTVLRICTVIIHGATLFRIRYVVWFFTRYKLMRTFDCRAILLRNIQEKLIHGKYTVQVRMNEIISRYPSCFQLKISLRGVCSAWHSLIYVQEAMTCI